MNTVKYAIVSANMTDEALQMFLIENPTRTMSIQKIFKRCIWWSSERVKEFAIGRILNVQDDPMLSWLIVGIRITNQ
jgi:hypothetical protein